MTISEFTPLSFKAPFQTSDRYWSLFWKKFQFKSQLWRISISFTNEFWQVTIKLIMRTLLITLCICAPLIESEEIHKKPVVAQTPLRTESNSLNTKLMPTLFDRWRRRFSIENSNFLARTLSWSVRSCRKTSRGGWHSSLGFNQRNVMSFQCTNYELSKWLDL